MSRDYIFLRKYIVHFLTELVLFYISCYLWFLRLSSSKIKVNNLTLQENTEVRAHKSDSLLWYYCIV